ncbi:MAG: hypothetical protein E7Z90_06000 [Cyanobacteria bacterium SIG29]|nr:hypothetical protein [Cyanobacteria bacterium SIG29]
MLVSKNFNNIAFGKTLVGTCAIQRKGVGSQSCFIFDLDKNSDYNYFDKINNAEDWDCAKYLDYTIYDLKDIEHKPFSIYVLETSKRDCLGFAQVTDINPSTSELLLLETVPSQVERNSKNHPAFKYIGETLLSFITKKLQSEGKERIEVYPAICAESFYSNKCFFTKYSGYDDPSFLPKEKFANLIKQNEKHTGKSIELVG